MYHGKVLAVTTAAATTATVVAMPTTGMNSAVQVAVAAAAGLGVWAGVYVIQAFFRR